MSTFSPDQISSLALWLDARDTTTFTYTTRYISSWRDKSPFSNIAVTCNITAGANDRNYLQAFGLNYFSTASGNPSNYFYIEPVLNVPTNSSLTIAFVSRFTANSIGISRFISFAQSTNGTTNVDFNSTPNVVVARSGSNIILYRNNVTITTTESRYNTPFLYETIFTGMGASVYFNGNLNPTFISSTGNFGFNRMAFGQNVNLKANDGLDGTFGEILVYSNALPVTERQNLEGYLAWKWGINQYLPQAHPYYYSPPGIPYISTTYTIPEGISVIAVNTVSSKKLLYLPPVSTVPGKLLFIKDTFGNSAINPISISTTGLDIIEVSTVRNANLNSNYGAWTLMNNGVDRWFFTNVYNNSLSITTESPFNSNQFRLPTYSNGLWVNFVSNTSSPPRLDATLGWGSFLSQPSSFTTLSFTNGSYPSELFNLPVSSYVIVQANGYVFSSNADQIRFRTVSDDGVTITINTSTVLCNWTIHAATTDISSYYPISNGYTSFNLKYFQNDGDALLNFSYEISTMTGFQSNLTNRFFFSTIQVNSNITILGSGLWVIFYDNPTAARLNINLPPYTSWGGQIGTPSNVSTINYGTTSFPQSNNIIGRFRGYYFSYIPDSIQFTFNIQFTIFTEVGVYATFNNFGLMTNYQGQPYTSSYVPVNPGYNPFEIVYYGTSAGSPFISMTWRTSNIPATQSNMTGRFFYDSSSQTPL